MASRQFLFPFLFIVFLSASIAPALSALAGGYQPIEDLNDPYVLEVAKFAVDEHNQKDSDHLAFVKILSGQSQVVAGTNYKLVIVAAAGANADGQYEALVYDKPWQKVRSLTSFQKL